MLKTDKIIVVEGRYDKIKLSSLIECGHNRDRGLFNF